MCDPNMACDFPEQCDDFDYQLYSFTFSKVITTRGNCVEREKERTPTLVGMIILRCRRRDLCMHPCIVSRNVKYRPICCTAVDCGRYREAQWKIDEEIHCTRKKRNKAEVVATLYAIAIAKSISGTKLVTVMTSFPCMRNQKWCNYTTIFIICPIAIAYSYGADNKIGLRLSVCVSGCLSVCHHSHGRISLSIFTKFDTEV